MGLFGALKNMGASNLNLLMPFFLEVADCLHWAYAAHYSCWFVGTLRSDGKQITDRDVQKVLLRLTKKRKLFSIKYGKFNIYTTKDRFNVGGENDNPRLFIEHGLGCTECLVRLAKCNHSGEVISEQTLRNFRMGLIPDFGILYPGKSLLLVEFSRLSNVLWKQNILGKLKKYRKALDRYKEIFGVSPVVLFVFDIPNLDLSVILDNFRKKDEDHLRGPFLFVEYSEFLKVPLGEALKAAIYTYGEDGQKYPLRYEPEL